MLQKQEKTTTNYRKSLSRQESNPRPSTCKENALSPSLSPQAKEVVFNIFVAMR